MKKAKILKELTFGYGMVIPEGTIVDVEDENVCSVQNNMKMIEICYRDMSFIVNSCDIAIIV